MIRRGGLTFYRVRFLEDDVHDGDVHPDDKRTDVEAWEAGELTAREAVDRIRREGLTFAATGGSWAADPDGSRIVDYGTGEREEVSAHLADEWPARVADAIMRAVDGGAS